MNVKWIIFLFNFSKEDDKKLLGDPNKNKPKDLKVNPRASDASSLLKPTKSPVNDKKPAGNLFFLLRSKKIK